MGPASIQVHYMYVLASGRACSGMADVRTVEIGGQNFIAGIDTLNGC